MTHQTMFRGASNLTLDAKGRLAMPSRYRDRLAECCGGKLVVTVHPDKCLLIYPVPDWEEVELRLMKLPSLNIQARRLQRLMVGYATELDLDGNGRILLPPSLREFGALNRDVILMGQGIRFELWDVTRYQEWLEQTSVKDDAEMGRPDELDKLSL